MLTIIIPAFNEGAVIGRLLKRILRGSNHDDIEIIIVANGCTDDTVDVASSFGPPVRVLTVPAASKQDALSIGDSAANHFPRIYIDADVELDHDGIWALANALKTDDVLAAGPTRIVNVADSRWPVRWYYTIWNRLPSVQAGLFGRGVVAVSKAGHQRLSTLPPLLADDLAASLAFASNERIVVGEARAIVHAPITLADLMRRRIRVVTGVTQIERSANAPKSVARTSAWDLFAIIRGNPTLIPQMLTFLTITTIARALGKRSVKQHGYSTWLRDESSRVQPRGSRLEKLISNIPD